MVNLLGACPVIDRSSDMAVNGALGMYRDSRGELDEVRSLPVERPLFFENLAEVFNRIDERLVRFFLEQIMLGKFFL